MKSLTYPSFDLLTTAVLLLDRQLLVQYVNSAAELLFGLNRDTATQVSIGSLISNNDIFNTTLRSALESNTGYNEYGLTLIGPNQIPLQVNCAITPIDFNDAALLIEFRQVDQQLRVAREERMREQQEYNRELIRNLAHEIRNPLGGIRGAAQLLERELSRADLYEYTGVIIKEAGRLQALMDRLLTPHRPPKFTSLNIHEVLERVRSLVLAEPQEAFETPNAQPRQSRECNMPLTIRRDYDVSLPQIIGDKEQLIQAILNIARNAAQALQGKGQIIFQTRVARQVTLAKKRYRHAVQISIIDNGPGVPEELKDKIFYPLVTGRYGGNGLGLPLAQHYIEQHHGSIEFTTHPDKTCFTVLLPVMIKSEG